MGSDGLEAAFVPALAMVGCSLRHRGEELLVLRGGLAAYADGSTMGIPLLHPWANRLRGERYAVAGAEVDVAAAGALVRRDPGGLPIHGVVPRALPFTPDRAGAGVARVRARYATADDGRALEAFPFPHAVTVTAELRPGELVLTTELAAVGDRPVPAAFGYHPYVRVPGAPRDAWVVTLPERRHLRLDEHMIPTGEADAEAAEEAPLGERTFDDGYAGIADGATFAVAGGGRRIEVVALAGYPFAQVYAPPGQDLICFEPMTAPADALTSGDGLRLVAPGETLAAAFAIRVADG